VWVLHGIDGSELVGPLQSTNNQGFAVEVANFSRDGTRLIVSLRNSLIRVWNATNGTPITDLLDLGGSGPHLALSPDGNSFVVGSWGSAMGYVCDTRVAPPKRLALQHPAAIPCVDFNPNGQNVATGADDGIARIWEAATGNLITDSIHRDGGISTIQFDPTGKRLLTSSTDGTIRLWDAGNGRALSEALRYEGTLNSVKISPDGNSLLLESDAEVQIWDLQPGGALVEPDWNPAESDDNRIISPDEKLEVRLEGNHNGCPTQARIMDRQTKKPLSDKLNYEANVFSARFSPDSQRLVLGIGLVNGEARGRAEVFDTRTGKRLMELPVNYWAVKCAEFSPDGRLIATGSRSDARVWDAQTGRPITEPLSTDGEVEEVSFSPDGSLLLTVSGRAGQVWNAKTGTKLFDLRHDGIVHHAEFNAAGTCIVTAGEDRAARIWQVNSGRLLHDLRHEAAVIHAAYSPDGKKVATVSRDNVARVWDASTGQQISERLSPPKPDKGHWVYSLRFADGGKRFEVASN
jgi:WD40 repeat protein